MHIIDRLARDLGQIMEAEMPQEQFNMDRFCIYCLLLIGHNRKITRRKPTESAKHRAVDTEDADVDVMQDEVDDEAETGCDAEFIGHNVVAFERLKDRVKTFRYANPYIEGLLFRDHYTPYEGRYVQQYLQQFGTLRIHIEAPMYVDDVLLLRRLQLAKSNASKKAGKENDPGQPTNMHLLLQRLCQLSRTESAWRDTQIHRSHTINSHVEPWFYPVAEALSKRRDLLKKKRGKLSAALSEQDEFPEEEEISATAHNRRKKYGPYWLAAGICSEKVDEELSLQDVLAIAPKPLADGFSEDQAFADLLRMVAHSLNTRYRLLRACGLPPKDWLHQDQPSIGKLKDLAELREQAMTILYQWAATGENRRENNRYRDAFEQAFEQMLQAPKSASKVAGFILFKEPEAGSDAARKLEEFEARRRKRQKPAEDNEEDDDEAIFLSSKVWQAMLNRIDPQEISISGFNIDPVDNREPSDIEIPGESIDVGGEIELQLTLEKLLQDAGPRLAENPALRLFFQEVLINKRDFMGRGGLWRDADFQQVIAELPRYAELNSEELLEKLFFDVKSLIFSVLVETAATPIDPLLYAFIQWVLIEEKPFRGKEGLYNQKSFRTLLAKYSDLNALAPDELFDELNAAAMELIAELFGGA